VGSVPSDPAVKGDADPYEHAWQFWWVGKALREGTDPRYCRKVFWPGGASLAFDHVGWFDTLILGALRTGYADPALAHGISLFAGTILTAVFGWLLARSWGSGRYGALFTALALAWLPSRTAHVLQHYQVANVWAFPAAMWAARSYLRDGRRMMPWVFAAASLAGALETPFISVFIFPGVLLTAMVGGGGWKRTVVLLGAWAVASAAAGMYLLTSPGRKGDAGGYWREAVYWAGEPQSFLLPSPFGAAAKILRLPVKFSWMPNTYEGVVTPGLAVLLPFLAFIWRGKRWKIATAFLVFAVLALGPELKLMGRPLGIPLPFRVLQCLPVLNGIRAPSRFAIPAGTIVALGAGLLVSASGKRWRTMLFAFLVLESAPLSLPALGTFVPGACSELSEDDVVLEVPPDPGVRIYSWFQTAGGYARLYAFMARPPEEIDPEKLLETALENGYVIIYHRWLFPDSTRRRLDGELAPLFPEHPSGDGIWMRGK